MGTATPFTREKIVVGVLISRPSWVSRVIERLQAELGQIDYQSPALPFTYTHYYDREMGTPISRLFVAIRDLASPDFLPAIKRMTDEIEHEFSDGARRRANLDPGMLALSRFSLATTKEGSHRIPVGGGIYAEVTVMYAGGRFQPLPWTYPDFRSEEYQKILCEIRDLYRSQLNIRSNQPATKSTTDE